MVLGDVERAVVGVNGGNASHVRSSSPLAVAPLAVSGKPKVPAAQLHPQMAPVGLYIAAVVGPIVDHRYLPVCYMWFGLASIMYITLFIITFQKMVGAVVFFCLVLGWRRGAGVCHVHHPLRHHLPKDGGCGSVAFRFWFWVGLEGGGAGCRGVDAPAAAVFRRVVWPFLNEGGHKCEPCPVLLGCFRGWVSLDSWSAHHAGVERRQQRRSGERGYPTC